MTTDTPTNAYQDRLNAKRDRLLERADQARERSAQLFEHGVQLGKYIPYGQPVLVGHHSEGKHRRFIDTLRQIDRRSIAESEKAQALVERASRVGTGGISSDDPEALAQLREQLAELEASQALMKAGNVAMRKLNTAPECEVALLALGVEPTEAKQVSHRGKYSYHLTNNNANIRRVAKRIEELEQLAGREAVEVEGQGWSYFEDTDDNRICVEFDGKPDEDTRSTLKSLGFKWSPSRGAWVRQITGNAIAAGQAVIRFLQSRDEARAA